MKRIITYVVLIITLIALGIIGYINKPLARPKEEILGITYYRYNDTTGNYDEFMIDKEKIKYTGSDYDLEGCEKYTYDPNTSIIKLDCNKAFRIGGETKQGIIIDMEEKRNFYYPKKENSYNYEFQKKYGTTEKMYKTTGENELRNIEIDVEKLIEKAIEEEISFIYIKDSTCETSCTIFNHDFKNFSREENIYYLNLDKITEEDIEKLNKEIESFPKTKKEITKDYPQVLVIKNNKIEEIIKISLKGFENEKYNNYAEKYGEKENENNEWRNKNNR